MYKKYIKILLLMSLYFVANTLLAHAMERPSIVLNKNMAGQTYINIIKHNGDVYSVGGGNYIPAKILRIADAVDVDYYGPSTDSYFVTSDGHLYLIAPNGEISLVDGIADVISAQMRRGYMMDGVVHGIILKSDGTVWGRGLNSKGALGVGSEYYINSFTKLANLANITEISFAGQSGLALRSDGTVWAWGDDGNSLVGHGLGVETSEVCSNGLFEQFYCSQVPRQVIGLQNIVAISSSQITYMALDSDGHVWTWGAGNNRPVMVPALHSVVKIAEAGSARLVLKSDGTVWYWGQTIDGVLGGPSADRPIMIEGLSSVVDIYSSPDWTVERVFAIKADGSVWGWGKGPLGDGGSADRLVPVAVIGEAGSGFFNIFGQTSQPVPVEIRIDGRESILSGSASSFAAVAIYGDGRTATIQPNWQIQGAGVSVNADGIVSTQFSGSTRVATLIAEYNVEDIHLSTSIQVNISANTPIVTSPQLSINDSYHGLVLMSDGRVWGFGRNDYGQVGDGTKTSRSKPVQVLDMTGVVQVAASRYNSFVVKQDGTVWGWGDNQYGYMLGNSSYQFGNSSLPVQVQNLNDIKYISLKDYDSGIGGYAVRADGSLWNWGKGMGPAQLVSNAPQNITSISGPLVLTSNGEAWFQSDQFSAIEKLEELTEVTQISSAVSRMNGIQSYYALDRGGHVWSWGTNGDGQLGSGTYESRQRPSQIAGLNNIISISSSDYGRAYAVDSDGFLWGWGDNSSIPMKVAGLSNVAKVESGYFSVIVLKSDGTLWSFGKNEFGELGLGVISDREAPSPMVNSQLSGFLDFSPIIPNIIPQDRIPPFFPAASIEGGNSALSLDVELNLNEPDLNLPLTLARIDGRSAGPVYNVYVAAIVPGGVAGLSQPALFMLNESNAWGVHLGGPLPEFMHNVEVASQDQRLMLRILSSVDVRQLVGTIVYVGYGTSDTEMLQSGRYRAVYTVSNKTSVQ